MVAYSFKKRFAEPIHAGTKAQTIRADRKRHARPGELTHLFTGMRTKYCRRLGVSVCIEATPIRMDLRQGVVFCNNGWIRSWEDLDALAVRDGFGCWDDLVAFWAAEHPGIDEFDGMLIRWQPLIAADPLDMAGTVA